MNSSNNITVTLDNKQYHVLFVGIHGGSGFGANYPYNGRYYLVSPSLWKKEKENYCMVLDSILPKAWGYYEKDGILLVEENNYPGGITEEILVELLSRLDSELLELYGVEDIL